MKQERCMSGCKFGENDRCLLYDTKLQQVLAPDPYDKGQVLSNMKCIDCMEKEISCSIDTKIREVYSFYEAFKQEMDILFAEVEILVDKREDIYKE
ncbi:MAG: hypothetical protein KAS32_19005 [Candidatus Peribacteraceae bacterium]|nr:hypothetical protein [Candidatus Peribacteraceae bacterium]